MSSPFDIFLPIIDLLTRALIILHDAFGFLGFPSWGLAIILFTIIIKIVTLPLTLKQLHSSKAMMAMQPALRELQKKYGKDRQKIAEEQMKLYKEYGVNPAAGCLPLLIQMPVWIALYQALFRLANLPHGGLAALSPDTFDALPLVTQDALRMLVDRVPEVVHVNFVEPFLWITNLGMPEGAPYIMAILTGATQWVVQRMTMPVDQDPQQASMNRIMQFMPLMFVVFAFSVPSGLVLYWVTSNLFSMVQQYFVTGWGSLANIIPALASGAPRQAQPAKPAAPSLSAGEKTAAAPAPQDATASAVQSGKPTRAAGAAPRRRRRKHK